MKDKSRYDYEERAAAQNRYDHWGQVRRTVNGKPVDEGQIELICDAIRNGLDINVKDSVIDIGCGNGALTYRFRGDVGRILGIDRSEYLVSIAKEDFQAENVEYMAGDALSVLRSISNIDIYNKALLYGVFSFFDDELAGRLFEYIANHTKINRIFIGNVRDRALAEKFYKREVGVDELDDHTSSMGKWRTREYFIDVCKQFGWRASFSKMPKEFYANEYYFDVEMCR